jgi:sulfite reductase alpha subunit-like flavoprotein
LWNSLTLANIIPLIENISDIPELEPAQYVVNIMENEANNDDKLDFLPPNGCKISPNLIIQLPIKGKIKENTRITHIGWNQDVRHLVIDVGGQVTPPFLGGDIATIHPKNSVDNVTRLINIINNVENESYESSTIIEIKKLAANNNRNNRIGNMTCSINNLFLRYLDIAGVPQRGFFEQLSLYSNNSDEKEKLFEISTGDGSDLYYDYCVKERRSYIDVLDEFKSSRPPLHRLLELIPPLSPRHYSIASSSIAYPTEVHLCVALVSYRTPYGRKREGICSKYFSNLNLNDEIILWIRSGYFKHPPNNNIPLILVGPGTGVAPMRALIQERNNYLIKTNNEISSDHSLNTLLFFGCRKENSDYLYGMEWNKYSLETNRILNSDRNNENIKLNNNILVTTAFSQDQITKVYVTHKIKSNGKVVWDAITNGGHIFVAGSAKKMPTDVYNSFVEVISEHGEMTKEKSDLILKKMQRLGKYTVEAWS